MLIFVLFVTITVASIYLSILIASFISEMNALVFPKCQVKVADRNAVITANAETVVVSPPGLQDAINAETGIFFASLVSFFCHDMLVWNM